MKEYTFTLTQLTESVTEALRIIHKQKEDASFAAQKMDPQDPSTVRDFLQFALGRNSRGELRDQLENASLTINYLKPLIEPIRQIRACLKHEYDIFQDFVLVQVKMEDRIVQFGFKNLEFKITKQSESVPDIQYKDILYVTEALRQILQIKEAFNAIIFAVIHGQPHVEIFLKASDVKNPQSLF